MLVEGWTDFAVLTGGASAALTGLQFVAISVSRDLARSSQRLRARAATTLLLLVVPLPIAMLVATPSQPTGVLGSELVVVAALLLAATAALDRRAQHSEPTAGMLRVLELIAPAGLLGLLVLAAGSVLIAGQVAGLYLVVAGDVTALVAGTANAWLYLTRLAADPAPSCRLTS